jgi:rod shape-determining protein MreD
MNKKLSQHAYLIIAIIVIKIIQINLSGVLRISLWAPDLGLIAIFMISHYIQRRYGMIYGFLYGFFHDLNLSVLGVNSLAKTVAGFVGGFFKFNEIYNHTTFAIGLFVVSLVNNIISFGINSYGVQSFIDVFFRYCVPNTIYTFVVGVLVYFLFENGLRKLYVRREQF